MAIVIRTRIQDDFSSNALTSFALARPAGRFSGLRTDGPVFQTDPLLPLPTHAKEAKSVYGHEGFMDCVVRHTQKRCGPRPLRHVLALRERNRIGSPAERTLRHVH